MGSTSANQNHMALTQKQQQHLNNYKSLSQTLTEGWTFLDLQLNPIKTLKQLKSWLVQKHERKMCAYSRVESYCLDIQAVCSNASSALPIFFLHRSMCLRNWAMASRGVLCWKQSLQICERRPPVHLIKRYTLNKTQLYVTVLFRKEREQEMISVQFPVWCLQLFRWHPHTARVNISHFCLV